MVLGPALVLLLIAGYLLSVGPAIYLRENGRISPDTVSRVYAPLGWLESHSDLFRVCLTRYAELWIP
jgi:hypothetical protein